ncbi:zinc-binding alcohol dehydrogenase family protein [Flagellimonas marina]|uniref:Zinc-binding alcohol dehydrogenase family protein n=1 Tax=Flagellimonas marina TaxID=1775168 RepID=A0ABV8PS43_9FLAO
MKYIICEKPGKLKLLEKKEPLRKKGEVLLKIKKVGVCGTDLHAYSGNQAFFTYPRILGHELAGEVEQIDDHSDIKVGDSVVVMPYVSCGKCIACRKGKTNCCSRIKVLGVHTDGGMQEKITVPEELLLPANGLSIEEMSIVEPLAIGAHAIRRAGLGQNDVVVVMGCGPIGIAIVKMAQIRGAKVISMDVDKRRLDYAKNKLGVDFTILATEDVQEKVAKTTHGDMASVVFDATGNKTAIEAGVNYMAHGGKYILVGLSKGELVFSHPKIHAKETTLMCSRNATLEDFEYVLGILKQKKFPTDSFITHNVGFKEMIAHFDKWLDSDYGVMKATIDF